MRTTSIISFISLHSLLLGVARVLTNRKKDALAENKQVKLSQNEQYRDSSLVMSRYGEEQVYNRLY